MITPICNSSRKKIARVCVSDKCKVSAFICKYCDDDQCEVAHKHDNYKIETIRWIDLSCDVQALQAKNTLEANLKNLNKEIEGINNQLRSLHREFSSNISETPSHIKQTLQSFSQNNSGKVTGKDINDLQLYILSNKNSKLKYENKISSIVEAIVTFKAQIRRICYQPFEEKKSAEEVNRQSIHDIDSQKSVQFVGGVNNSEDGKKYSPSVKVEINNQNEPGEIAAGENQKRREQTDTAPEENQKKQAIQQSEQGQIQVSSISHASESKNKQKDAQKDNSLISEAAFTEVTTGTQLGKANKLEQAEICFTRAIRQCPKYEKAYYLRAGIYEKLKQYPKAVEDYRKVIELNPKNALAYNSLGLLYVLALNNAAAFQHYDKAIQIDQACSFAYYNRANLFQREGMNNQALEDYNRAIHLKPGFVEALTNRGNLLWKEKRQKQAENDFNKAISIAPTNYLLLYNRGHFYFKICCYKSCLEDLNRCITLNQNFAKAYHTRSQVYMRFNWLEECLADLNTAINLNNTFIPFYESRADCYKKLSHKAEYENELKTIEAMKKAKSK